MQIPQPSNTVRTATPIVTLLLLLMNAFGQQPDRQLVQNNSQSGASSKRIALVIGNGAYTTAPPLKNPPNDARDMAATLKTLGFDVTSGVNLNQRDMKRLIREFGLKLKTGGSGLFYYAGHGVQSKGRNYLIPVDANIQSEAEVEDSGVDAALVLNFMDDAQNGLNIVILDACRNNPFARSFRSANDGLAQVDAPTGTLIAYATAPGRVASDGANQNGLYTAELLKQMRTPGLSVTDMFMRVRAEVMKQTANKQVPWEASSLVGSFYFAGTSSDSSPIANTAKIDPVAFELSYWETIKNSTSADDFKAYLARYPQGQFTELARNRIAGLGTTAKPAETSSPGTSGGSATELAFWDAIKNSTSADDYQAYLKKYPNGEFVELATGRLRSLEAANKARGKIFEVDWEVSADSFSPLRLVIFDTAIHLQRDEQTLRSDAQRRASVKYYNEDVETSYNRLSNWYKDYWNCSAFSTANNETLFIRNVRPDGSSIGAGHPTYRLRFKSAEEATAALAGIRGVCSPGNPASSAANETPLKTFHLQDSQAKAGWAKDKMDFVRLVVFQSHFVLEPLHRNYSDQLADCSIYNSAKVEGAQISEIHPKGSAMYFRFYFDSAADAAAALNEIRRICGAKR